MLQRNVWDLKNNIQLHYKAKVFLQFRLFFEPRNKGKMTRNLARKSFVVSSKYLHLPWFPSFELPVCFMLSAVPTTLKLSPVYDLFKYVKYSLPR